MPALETERRTIVRGDLRDMRARLALVLAVAVTAVSLSVPLPGHGSPVSGKEVPVSMGFPAPSPPGSAALPANPANCSQGSHAIWQAPPTSENQTTWQLLSDYDTLGEEGGGTLYLAAGTFVLEEALDLPGFSNVSIQGAGEGATVLSLPPDPVGTFRADNGSVLGLYNASQGAVTNGSTINFIELGLNSSQVAVNNFALCDLSLDAQATDLNETWSGSLIYDQSGGRHHVYSDLAETGFFAPSGEPNGLHILSYLSAGQDVLAQGYVIEGLQATEYSYPYVAYPGAAGGFNFLNVGYVSNCTVDAVSGIGLWEFDARPDPGCLFENLEVEGRMLIDPDVGGSWAGSLIENATVSVNGTPSPDALSTSVANGLGHFNSNMTGLTFYNDTFVGTVLGGRNMVDVQDSTFYGGLNDTPALFVGNRVVWIDDNSSRINLPIRVYGSSVNGTSATLADDTFVFPNGTAVYPGDSRIADPFRLEVPVQRWSSVTVLMAGNSSGFLFLAPGVNLTANSSFEELSYRSAGDGAPDALTLANLTGSPGFVDRGAVVLGLAGIADDLPPASPTGLAARSASPTSVALNWTPPGGAVSNYTIRFGPTAASLTSGENVTAGNETAWTVPALARSTTYFFAVWAWTAEGQSPGSTNVAEATTGVPLSAPSELAGTAGGVTTIDWSWHPATGGAVVNNTLYLFAGTGCTAFLGGFSAGIASGVSTPGLARASNYSAEVTAWNASGQGPASSCADASTPSIPTAPAGVRAQAVGPTWILWEWNNSPAPDLTNTSLLLFPGRDCSGAPTVITLPRPVSSYEVAGLVPGATYSFEVADWDIAGQGPPSTCVSAATSGGAALPWYRTWEGAAVVGVAAAAAVGVALVVRRARAPPKPTGESDPNLRPPRRRRSDPR